MLLGSSPANLASTCEDHSSSPSGGGRISEHPSAGSASPAAGLKASTSLCTLSSNAFSNLFWQVHSVLSNFFLRHEDSVSQSLGRCARSSNTHSDWSPLEPSGQWNRTVTFNLDQSVATDMHLKWLTENQTTYPKIIYIFSLLCDPNIIGQPNNVDPWATAQISTCIKVTLHRYIEMIVAFRPKKSNVTVRVKWT